jgi:hypothetical protein
MRHSPATLIHSVCLVNIFHLMGEFYKTYRPFS